MHPHSRALVIAAMLLVGFAGAIGCQRNGPDTGTIAPLPTFPGPGALKADPDPGATKGSPKAIATVIELSEPEVTWLGPMSIRFEVKYRFKQGKPDAESWYTTKIDLDKFGYVGGKQMAGKNMPPEGIIRHDIRLLEGGAGSFRIQMDEAPSESGPFLWVSNTVTGVVKH